MAGLNAVGSPRLALLSTGTANHRRAEVEERLCSGWPGSQWLFGGFVISGCVDALQQITGLPVQVAACHFVSMARPGEMLEYEVACDGAAALRQHRLTVRSGERVVARALAIAGSRSGEDVPVHLPLAIAPPPEDCRPFSIARLMSSNVHALFETRLVEGQLPDSADWTCSPANRCRFWVRTRDGARADRITLAAMGDFLAIGLPGAVGAVASATSLDNHLRFLREGDAGWVLCDATIDAVAAGLVHGRIVMRDSGRNLLAIGSQTMVFRRGK